MDTISVFLSKITFFDFQKAQVRPSLSSLVARLCVWLNNMPKCPRNTYVNCSDYARALNMPDHLTCLTGKGRVLNMGRLYVQGLRRVPNMSHYGSIHLNNA